MLFFSRGEKEDKKTIQRVVNSKVKAKLKQQQSRPCKQE
jgi:hypothetical protein